MRESSSFCFIRMKYKDAVLVRGEIPKFLQGISFDHHDGMFREMRFGSRGTRVALTVFRENIADPVELLRRMGGFVHDKITEVLRL